MVKVAVANGNEATLRDPVLGRPFSHNLDRVQYVEDPVEADWILGNLHYLDCERDFLNIARTRAFQVMPEKFVFWSMHDTPMFAYAEGRSLKFICQPLAGPVKNKEMNIVSVPLQMRHFELDLISDIDFINECRSTEKEYDFVYVGQIVYAHRDYLAKLRLSSYDFEVTNPIWGIKDTKSRVDMMKDFCRRLSRADYAFAPRGVGSSSFRLYQAMMSGAVPIVSGMAEYPFSDEVDWNEFCIINERQDQYDFVSLINSPNYEQMRDKAIQFWEDYVRVENCDKRLFDKYLAG
tara:strand:+ start:2321 stop:3196 length:876 start_codon:yes stop_codon:yes gene_type:complete